jgi:hypothetical protein
VRTVPLLVRALLLTSARRADLQEAGAVWEISSSDGAASRFAYYNPTLAERAAQ